MSEIKSEYPGPGHVLVHVSEPHFVERTNFQTLLLDEVPRTHPVDRSCALGGLRVNQVGLAEVLEGSDVIGIFSGHTHCSVFSTFGGGRRGSVRRLCTGRFPHLCGRDQGAALGRFRYHSLTRNPESGWQLPRASVTPAVTLRKDRQWTSKPLPQQAASHATSR